MQNTTWENTHALGGGGLGLRFGRVGLLTACCASRPSGRLVAHLPAQLAHILNLRPRGGECHLIKQDRGILKRNSLIYNIGACIAGPCVACSMCMFLICVVCVF